MALGGTAQGHRSPGTSTDTATCRGQLHEVLANHHISAPDAGLRGVMAASPLPYSAAASGARAGLRRSRAGGDAHGRTR